MYAIFVLVYAEPGMFVATKHTGFRYSAVLYLRDAPAVDPRRGSTGGGAEGKGDRWDGGAGVGGGRKG